MAKKRPLIERLMSHVRVDPDGCWVWTGALSYNGYARAQGDGKSVRVHRAMYEHHTGPIPDGLVLDHLCRNRACVNPAHLEAVTHGENVRRGALVMLTHCRNGHPMSEANMLVGVYAGKPYRRCRECMRVNQRRHYAKAKP